MTENSPIITAAAIRESRRFLGLSKRQSVAIQTRSNSHVFVYSLQADGQRTLRRVVEASSSISVSPSEDLLIYAVSLDIFAYAPTFSEVLIDQQGNAWDCRIWGRLWVTDSERALTSFGLSLAGPDSALTAEIVEAWIANRLAAHVSDAVRHYTIVDLRDHHALPVDWWQKQLSEWLDELGVSISVERVEWSSAQAEAVEAEAARKRDIQRLERARDQERQAELRELAARTEYEIRKNQIESNLELTERQRVHQLHLLQRRYEKELIEADRAVADAHREAELAAAEHEATLAGLRQKTESLCRSIEDDRRAQNRHNALLEEFRDVKGTLAKLIPVPHGSPALISEERAWQPETTAQRVPSEPEATAPGARTVSEHATAEQAFNLIEDHLLAGRHREALRLLETRSCTCSRGQLLRCLAGLAVRPMRKLRNSEASELVGRLTELATTDERPIALVLLAALSKHYYHPLRRRIPLSAAERLNVNDLEALDRRSRRLATLIPETHDILDEKPGSRE